MFCSYTNIPLSDRRFGIPSEKKDGRITRMIGTFASVGVVIRYYCSKLQKTKGLNAQAITALHKIGLEVGINIELERMNKEIKYNSDQLCKLVALAAPHSSTLEINGGTLSRKAYEQADPTWGKYLHLSQSKADMEAQKEELAIKKGINKVIKNGKEDENGRWFFFPVVPLDYNGDKVIRVDYETLVMKSGFFSSRKQIDTVVLPQGYRIAFSGGCAHNSTATKMLYRGVHEKAGNKDASNNILKGDVVIFVTKGTPLDLSEYMEEASGYFLENYQKAQEKTSVVVSKKEEVGAKKQRTG